MSESDDVLELKNDSVSVLLSRRGAELRALRIAGHDLLWTPDPSVWSGTCPILFPIIARVRDDAIRVDGRRYEMPMHGFAARKVFAVSQLSQGRCTLVLTQDEDTLKQFPFSFALSVTYSVGDAALDVAFQIRNEDGDSALPVSLGFHPGFRWPLEDGAAKSDYSLGFEADEALVYTRPVDRLVGPVRNALALRDGMLPLDERLFDPTGILIIGSKSRRVTFGRRGGVGLSLDYPDFPQLILWMRPGSPFLCIEPCAGYADPIDFDGDFRDKPGISLIRPRSSLDLRLRIGLTESN